MFYNLHKTFSGGYSVQYIKIKDISEYEKVKHEGFNYTSDGKVYDWKRLLKSMELFGYICPIQVKFEINNNHYYVIDGKHRYVLLVKTHNKDKIIKVYLKKETRIELHVNDVINKNKNVIDAQLKKLASDHKDLTKKSPNYKLINK
jgi:hypothetical protein